MQVLYCDNFNLINFVINMPVKTKHNCVLQPLNSIVITAVLQEQDSPTPGACQFSVRACVIFSKSMPGLACQKKVGPLKKFMPKIPFETDN